MRRRDFMTVLAGTATYAFSADAQKTMPVIGVLTTGSATPGPNAPFVAEPRAVHHTAKVGPLR